MKNKFKKLFIIFLAVLLTLFSTVSCNITFVKNSGASLEFTLTEKEVQSYIEVAKQAEENLPSNTNVLSVNSYVNNLINGLYYINEQFAIAQINYFTDMSVASNKEKYKFALTSANTARASYKNALKAVWNSNNPLKSSLFQGISDAEANALFNTPEEVDVLNQEIDVLTSEYLTLSTEELQEKTGPIYAKIVTKYNRIADLCGFENYYTYASGFIYERDYEPTKLSEMTTYMKTYILPLYADLLNSYNVKVNSLNAIDKQIIKDITSKSFKLLSTDYIGNYVNSLNVSTKKGMNDMFTSKNYTVANSTNSYDGAFTIGFQHTAVPYCYFGPSYQDIFTIIHELGHYYAEYCNPNKNIPLDIAEIHSQANELMFLIYLKDVISNDAYEVLALDSVLDVLRASIVSNLMNEFEMRVFTRNVENYTSVEFDAIMTEVMNEFGLDFLQNTFRVDLYNYWKRAIIQQPCYYISYSVSGITALGLYCQAIQSQADYKEALTKYDNLCNADFTGGLTQTLASVNVSNPFNLSTFETISNALKTETTQPSFLLVA